MKLNVGLRAIFQIKNTYTAVDLALVPIEFALSKSELHKQMVVNVEQSKQVFYATENKNLSVSELISV